ncbi:hypothetical protein LSCM1_07984 [Leishmania martiniquensis]|uniref:Uncharacterized protein n=1 Tax=Leishmania martiniquensis TaxID=1580590 RepID=A0A836I1N8_9TRYP|nr:hypothetical protein LSCM1_07984 [Leishmania martiniquensis]
MVWPPSWAMPHGAGDAVGSFSACAGNTSTSTTTTTCPGAASRHAPTWQTLTEDMHSTMAYAATVQQTKELLSDFESYQRSLGASLFPHGQLHAAPRLGCPRLAGRAIAAENAPQAEAATCRPRDSPSADVWTEVHGRVDNADVGQAVQLALASPAQWPSLTLPLEPAALELAKRRALGTLYGIAQARAAYANQGRPLSGAMHGELLRRPGVVGQGVLAAEGSSSQPLSAAVALSDGHGLFSATGAGGAPRISHVSASPMDAMPAMSEAEREAATAEADRALSLLRTIRAMRQETEELTVLLLHAFGAWGCWLTPAADVAPRREQTGAPLAASLPPRGTRHAQRLFADLFPMAPLKPRALQASPPGAVPGGSGGFSPAGPLPLGTADDADTPRLSAVDTFARNSAHRRERACRVLWQALQRQQQRWPPFAATPATTAALAGEAFLELALAPPRSAVPPPPPMSVQLDLYATQQSALQGAIRCWRGAAAQTVAAGSSEAVGLSLSTEAATPHGPLPQQLPTLSTQQRQLRHSCDVTQAAAVQRRHTSTHSRAFAPQNVQPCEAMTVSTEDVDAGGGSHAACDTSKAVPIAHPQALTSPAPPGDTARETLLPGPSSLPKQHSSPASSPSSEASPPSDTLLISSVQLAVDRTRAFMDPPMVLEASASVSEPPSRRADALHAAAAPPMNAEVLARAARVPVQQAGQSTKEEAGLVVREALQSSAGRLHGSDASARASSANAAPVAHMLCPSSSSSTPSPSPSAVDVRGGLMGAPPEACEASRHLRTSPMPSTHPPEALQAATRREQEHAAQRQEGRRRRKSDGQKGTAAAALRDSVGSRPSRCTPQQEAGTRGDGAASTSPLAHSSQDLAAASAGMRSTSPRLARSATVTEPLPAPPPRAVEHDLEESVAPSSRSAVRVVTTANVSVHASQSNESEAPRASLLQQKGSSSPHVTSAPPSHLSRTATSPESKTTIRTAPSTPHAAAADAAAPSSSTLSVPLPAVAAEGASNEAAAPLGLPLRASAAAAQPSCAPPLTSVPTAKLADDGGSAGVMKLPQRQERRNFFSRLFSCGC